MKHTFSQAMPGDRLASAIAERLSQSCADLDHDITERLRVARQQALARRKAEAPVPARRAASIVRSGGEAVLQRGGQDSPSLWTRLGTMLPLLALVGGLLAIEAVQNDNRASDVAEVDAALLTDDLPTAAYTDPGFLEFLRVGGSAPQD